MLTFAASLEAFGADPKVITVPDPNTVSPGFLGFAVTFLLAAATILLIRSMVAHVRKVGYLPEPEDQPQTRNSGSANSGSNSGPTKP